MHQLPDLQLKHPMHQQQVIRSNLKMQHWQQMQHQPDMQRYRVMHQLQHLPDIPHNLGVRPQLLIRHCQRVRHRLDTRQDRGLQLKLDMRHCQVMHQVLLQLDTLHNRGVRPRQDTQLYQAMHRVLDTRQDQGQQLNLVTQRYQGMRQVPLHLDMQHNQVALLKRDMQRYQLMLHLPVMLLYPELHQPWLLELLSARPVRSLREHFRQPATSQEAHSPADRSPATVQGLQISQLIMLLCQAARLKLDMLNYPGLHQLLQTAQ